MTPADRVILRVFRELHAGDRVRLGDSTEAVGNVCRRVAERCGVPASRVWEALHRQEAAS